MYASPLLSRKRTAIFPALITLMLLFGACGNPVKKESAQNTPEPAPEAETGPEIKPISHATAVLSWGGTILYLDPVGGADAFSGHPAPDVILITDVHGDHYNRETLEAVAGSATRIIAPEAVIAMMPERLAQQATALGNGAVLPLGELSITAIPMYNLREEALQFHVKGRGNGYVLEQGGVRVYVSGDTEDIPEMRALEDIDIALVCMNLPYTMTVERAADAVLEFRPKRVLPYHYRGNPEVSDVSRFRTLVEAGNPGIEVVQLDWYPGQPY